jgi:predicted nuclease of predicted toxin-antitoxin system
MMFVVDENLPRQVATWLSSVGHPSVHLSDLGLLGQPDAAIWMAACDRTASIVTRDADFLALARRDDRAAVVRLLIGNCSTVVLIARLAALWPEIERRLVDGERIVEIG